jgi:hypothetical protein
LDLQKKQETQ